MRQHRFLFRRFAVVHKEVVDLVFGAFGEVFTPHNRVARDQWRFPDHLQRFQLVRRGGLQLVEVFSVVGGNVYLLVRYGQGVGFVAGVNRALEVAGGDVVFREDVVTRDEEAGRRIRVAVTKGQLFAFGEHIVEVVDRAVFVNDQHAPVARGAVCCNGLGKDLAVGAIYRFHGREVAVPGDVDFVEAHSLDNARVVRGEEGVHFDPQFGFHIFQERFPLRLQVLL